MKKPKDDVRIVPISVHDLILLMECLTADLTEAVLNRNPGPEFIERWMDTGDRVMSVLQETTVDGNHMAATLLQLAVGILKESPAFKNRSPLANSATCSTIN